MKYEPVDPAVVQACCEAASEIRGQAKRSFVARMAEKFCHGVARHAETVFGWNRKMVQAGFIDLRDDHPQQVVEEHRGRCRVEDSIPGLKEAVTNLVDEKSATDPTFQSTLKYTRITGQTMREALAQTLGISLSRLPSIRTLRRVLNRYGYSLKKVRKVVPTKKIPETDAIFEHVQQAHRRADGDSSILRISIDTKAKVKIGPFSRGGYSRRESDRQAADHDMQPCELLVPCGILEIPTNQLTIGFGKQVTTSDMIVDNLECWWEFRRKAFPEVKTLMIDSDNGPEVSSRRTQFVKRMVEFADKTGLKIEMVYYPPYHSKYNRIERCWGALECHWNGSILSTVEAALKWASSMTWNQIQPFVWTLEKTYTRGVRLAKQAYASYEARLNRQADLKPWAVSIAPASSS